jgi:hypothetical protein
VLRATSENGSCVQDLTVIIIEISIQLVQRWGSRNLPTVLEVAAITRQYINVVLFPWVSRFESERSPAPQRPLAYVLVFCVRYVSLLLAKA